jgi:hypothetical protein
MAKATVAAVAERVAVLEVYNKETRADVKDLKTSMADISAKLDQALFDLERNKGAWGGVLMVTTALWAAITQLWEPISRLIRGQ